MATPFSIDGRTGALRLGCVTLGPGAGKSDVERRLAHLVRGSRDMRTGYEWLDLAEVTFGGQPASLGLCFHHGRLCSLGWNVALPGASKAPEGWPTRQSIDNEVAFVRSVLARDIGFDPKSTYPTEFEWGSVVSVYNDREGVARNAVLYRGV